MSNKQDPRGLAKIALWLHSMSVFKTTKEYAMNDSMATMFHRLAATTYFSYAGWSLAVLSVGTPSLYQQHELLSLLFPAVVFLTATPACIGATFFPHAARLELFSGSVFTMMIIIYIWISIQSAMAGVGLLSTVLLVFGILLMPACRTGMIVYFLIRQAEARNTES